MRMPDSPTLISLDVLRLMDKHPHGTWLAQSKMDGWRRVALNIQGVWHWKAKPGGSGALKPLPAELEYAFERLAWPEGIGLDIEWMGQRGGSHSLHVFDMIYAGGEFLDKMPFEERYALLAGICEDLLLKWPIVLLPVWGNPHLLDAYIYQLTTPGSEGLVIRKADCLQVGGLSKCLDNPFVFKVKHQKRSELALKEEK